MGGIKMPKKLDYPNNCSLKEAIQIAELVKKAGGKANRGFIADGLSVKENTGAFRSKIASALKYGLIERKGQEINLTKIADKYFYPLPGTDKKDALIEAFKSVTLFQQILARCSGQEIDKKTLVSLLVHEFDVDRNIASKIAGYFLKANELVPFLDKINDGKFKVPQQEGIDSDKTNKEDKGLSNQNSEANGSSGNNLFSKIDKDMFDLLLNMGKLLFNEKSDDKNSILKDIKEIIGKRKEELSHSDILIDLLDSKNVKIIEKLKYALKKDLGIKEDEVASKVAEQEEDEPVTTEEME